MPTLTLRLTGCPEHEGARAQATQLAGALTDLTALHLGKRADLTAVLVQWLPGSQWFIGGQPLSDRQGAQVEIAITEGTNTAAQKAEWMGAVHALLREHLPDLAEVTYAVVQELPATAWGYGGRTQASRKPPG